MSKSYGNTIPLFGTRDEIAAAVMSIVTDSAGERPENVYAIHRVVKNEGELQSLYESYKGKYKSLKEALIEDLDKFLAPMREKRDSISDDDVRAILKDGAARARERASAKMTDVRAKIGLTL
jgi:tryptophanyl-tRNA synthetase